MAKLQLPDCNSLLLFRAIERQLKHNGDLKRVVKTWRFYHGDNNDVAPPDLKQTPWFRMRPIPMQGTVIAECLTRTPITYQIELMVEGTLLDDILNLWAAIERALFPNDGTMMTIINTHNCTGLVLTQPAIATGKIGDDHVTTATGAVQVNMLTSTSY